MADENLELNELEEESPLENTGDNQAIDINELSEIENLPKSARDLEAVYDIPVQVSAVLGKSTMQVSELLKLGRGAVIELDRKVGEAIDIYVNN